MMLNYRTRCSILAHSHTQTHTHVQYTHATHQSQHAWRLLHGSAAAKEAHHHHESPRCDQDVHTWQTHKEPIIKTRNASDLFFSHLH